MKKMILFILAALFALALSAPALADGIWEPDYDEFFFRHRDECVYTDAHYEAQSDSAVYETPERDSVVTTIPAGTVVYIGYTWTSDTTWGYCEYSGESGWVELGDFRKLYDASDFRAEHAEELTEAGGTVSLAENAAVVLWAFPGSGEIVERIDSAEWDWADDPAYYETYTDEEGRAWGHVNYFYALSGWICLDEPGAEDLPAAAPRYADGEDDAFDPVAAFGVNIDKDREVKPLGPVMSVLLVVIAAATVIICIPAMKKDRKGK